MSDYLDVRGPRWQPIDTAPNQTEVLVCSAGYLGWWAIAIQNALGEWWLDGTQSPPKYKPTHWMELPRPVVTGHEAIKREARRG
ncbi:hypothetical protein [Sphingomonas oryzagri]|uniref:DUF551 domain-containing protein n=1 Tax=Sphingomonas oryzagri TaxID=3042314 RepID=A0ABT6N0Y8_9SPHN|nr:hypothetical protein [Sphingomonas oryzagri]MDH7638980.1 hypothetical protein [Sphingomonas oryzagri]